MSRRPQLQRATEEIGDALAAIGRVLTDYKLPPTGARLLNAAETILEIANGRIAQARDGVATAEVF